MKFPIFIWNVFFLIFSSLNSDAQVDTLRIMSYNTLNYGDGCQGGDATIHDYLKKIIAFTNPNIAGLVKMKSIKVSNLDSYGFNPVGYADSILKYAFNAAYPGKYAYCPFTNSTRATESQVLFYDKTKLGYISTQTLYSNIIDFNLYKLYYKSPNLASTKDTTFLYLVLNHVDSGAPPNSIRDQQITKVLEALKVKFRQLPNLIHMGDFNMHDSNQESGYQALVNTNAGNFRFFDPPVFPDQKYTYPIYSDSNPAAYGPLLTTSTRASSTNPNSCGTSGGGKSWYDRILLSPWIINKKAKISYLSNSYKTIGNDGNRKGISINDSTFKGKNTSAPNAVIDALWHLSNKYPIMLNLLVDPLATVDTIYTGINEHTDYTSEIQILVTQNYELQMQYSGTQDLGKTISILVVDITGKLVVNSSLSLGYMQQIPLNYLSKGVYTVILSDGDSILKIKRIFVGLNQ